MTEDLIEEQRSVVLAANIFVMTPVWRSNEDRFRSTGGAIEVRFGMAPFRLVDRGTGSGHLEFGEAVGLGPAADGVPQGS